ncbi:MAG: hypothetical protein GY804_12070 [Alphaproteobacteria bacterium]|nr:hypothetical protein [Alphaproteobacteria bacterium]
MRKRDNSAKFVIRSIEKDRLLDDPEAITGIFGGLIIGDQDYPVEFQKDQEGKWGVAPKLDTLGNMIRERIGEDIVVEPVLTDDLLAPKNFRNIELDEHACVDLLGQPDRYPVTQSDKDSAANIVQETVLAVVWEADKENVEGIVDISTQLAMRSKDSSK